MALFPRPSTSAGARRKLLDFMVQGKISRGRHTDHPAKRHSIRTNQCLLPTSTIPTVRKADIDVFKKNSITIALSPAEPKPSLDHLSSIDTNITPDIDISK